MKYLRTSVILLCVLSSASQAMAALSINAALPITERVTVQPIIVSNDDGSNTAEYFGTPSQQAEIIGFVNQIWAQAGIEVSFLTPNTWNNTFANVGTSAPAPRPTSDLNTIVTTGDAAGVGHVDPLVLDIYFVEIAAGFPNTSENTANGLAFRPGNGVSQHVGDNLPGFLGGREVIASVVSHEIGHNLGLPHIVEIENLMQAGGSPNPGERLNASQISTALASNFSVAVPEPSGLAVLATAAVVFTNRRQKRKITPQLSA